jgi:eukaryotic-like serine/threonine-protein kinase
VELTKNATIAGRYQLGRLLGEGGMGAVWAATELATGRAYALKFLNREDPTPQRRRRFLREARAAMAMAHPNVVRIHEVIADGDATAGEWPFLVMDLLEGESLAARLERTPRLSLDELAPMFAQIVSAAGAAHASGIVHRDLKPGNIFLVSRARDGETVRVLDFGIAKLTTELDGTSTSLTATGDVLGTPHYMSPEQIFGESDVDHRSDVWSLGVIAFQCLAGSHPVTGDNVGQILKAITTGRLTRLTRVAPELPPAITELVDRMLSRDRRDRPRDLREVLATFRRFTTVDVPAIEAPHRSSTDDASPRPPAGAGDTLDDAADRPAPVRSKPRPAMVIALATTAIASFAGYALLQRSGSVPSAPTHADVHTAAEASSAATSPSASSIVATASSVAASGIGPMDTPTPPPKTLVNDVPLLRPKGAAPTAPLVIAPPSASVDTAKVAPAASSAAKSATIAPPVSSPSAHATGGLITKAPF